ncbi:MAG: putative zinc-binding protein [Desulfobacterales bacterium]|nr:putative zinc-binding protein [Desulfobacterales bacterium]
MMNDLKSQFTITYENATGHCPAGEKFSRKMMDLSKTPVISCEGSCIRGEIARLAANMVAKEDEFARGCHGEFLSVPHSTMAKWAEKSKRIVVIDGCFLHCHGRLMQGIYGKDQLAVFDALSFYGKYTDLMDIDDVPAEQRKDAAVAVFKGVLNHLDQEAPLCVPVEANVRCSDKSNVAESSCCS